MTKLDDLAEKAKKIAEESGVKLEALKDSEEFAQMKKVAADLGEEAAVFVRKYPLQSVLGAAVAGLVVGLSLGRKK